MIAEMSVQIEQKWGGHGKEMRRVWEAEDSRFVQRTRLSNKCFLLFILLLLLLLHPSILPLLILSFGYSPPLQADAYTGMSSLCLGAVVWVWQQTQ